MMTLVETIAPPAPAEFEDRYVTVNGIRLRYWQAGQDGPPLLLLHGLNGCVEHWRPTIAGLSATHRVWALDGPGHGLSDSDDRSYDQVFMRDLISGFVQSQGLRRTSIAALSGSGLVALKLALDCPELLDRLVLVDAAGLGRGINMRMRLLSTAPLPPTEVFERPYSREEVRYWVALAFFADPAKLTDAIMDDLYVNVSRPHTMLTAARLIRWGVRWWGQRYVFSRQLWRIQAPTLIVWGKQDKVLPVAHAYGAAKKIPNARLHVFDPCGHLPMLECADQFNAVVSEFLAAT